MLQGQQILYDIPLIGIPFLHRRHVFLLSGEGPGEGEPSVEGKEEKEGGAKVVDEEKMGEEEEE